MTDSSPETNRTRFSARIPVLMLCCYLSFFSLPAQAGFGNDIKQIWLAQLGEMTGQLIGSFVDTTGMIGGFFDGSQVLTTQTKLQQLQADAIRDYTPGENLCRFGTLSRSLSLSEEGARANKLAVSTYLLDRESGKSSRAPSAQGHEKVARFENLRKLYCDPGDNDKTPAGCNCNIAAGTCTAGVEPMPSRQNRDLDFSRLWDNRLTLDVDYTTPTLTPDKEDLNNFLANITSPDLFPRFSVEQMRIAINKPEVRGPWQDMRQIMAARGVVRNSLSQMIGQKSAGAGAVSSFMTAAMQELGFTADQAKRYLKSDGQITARPGNAPAANNIKPSYAAQLEVLTKSLYQNPNFYVNLIDKPAEVQRTRAAMTAISLMQKREIFNAMLRREMLLSQLLELKIKDYSKSIEQSTDRLRATGE